MEVAQPALSAAASSRVEPWWQTESWPPWTGRYPSSWCLTSTIRSGRYVQSVNAAAHRQLWVDTHVDPPLKRRHETLNEVVDRYVSCRPCAWLTAQLWATSLLLPSCPVRTARCGAQLTIRSILLGLRRAGIGIGAASRTAAPSVARQALRELLLDQEHAAELMRGPRRSAPPSKARSLVKAISTWPPLDGQADGRPVRPPRNLSRYAPLRCHTR